jgi:DMSO/TMAO reductase YedYZ molybdopterin-dependent catalytic subunit
MGLPLVERTVEVDCYGGIRNSHVVKGLLLLDLCELAKARGSASSAIFYCADGYCETGSLLELLQQEALLAYPVNGERVDELDYLPRLAVPGKYGFKWAKWVERVRLVAGETGHWANQALPEERARPDASNQTPAVSARSFPLPPPC